MSVKAKLVPIFLDNAKEINIFFHGFCAVKSKNELDLLILHILSAKPRGRVYLFYWKSGDWKVSGWLTALKSAHRVYKIAKAVTPIGVAGGLLDAIALNAGLAIFNFKRMETRSEDIGKNIKRHISHIPFAKELPINLIGHSLGARLIQTALATNDFSEYNIKDCVMLGSAADSDTDWSSCIMEIKGKIFNAYSKKDNILKITPDIRTRAGTKAITGHKRVSNLHFQGYGHVDYWPRLEYVLEQIWPNFKQTRYPSEFLDESIVCPLCNRILFADTKGDFTCGDCRRIFLMSVHSKFG